MSAILTAISLDVLVEEAVFDLGRHHLPHLLSGPQSSARPRTARSRSVTMPTSRSSWRDRKDPDIQVGHQARDLLQAFLGVHGGDVMCHQILDSWHLLLGRAGKTRAAGVSACRSVIKGLSVRISLGHLFATPQSGCCCGRRAGLGNVAHHKRLPAGAPRPFLRSSNSGWSFRQGRRQSRKRQ